MYQCAYTLERISSFSKWDLHVNIESSLKLTKDTIVYLREDFTVHASSLSNEAPIFSELSPDWIDFCKTNLGFSVDPYKLHPMNRDFKWKLCSSTLRFLTPEQAQFYDTYGYVVIEKAFDEHVISEVTREIDYFEAEVEATLRNMEDGKGFIGRADEITFSTHLVKKSNLLRNFCSSKLFQDLTFDLIGPNVRLYWDHAVYKKPGGTRAFPWHQDNGYTFLEPQQYLTCWIALTDADENNGCFWVTPFVHKLGTLAHKLTDLGHICYDITPASAISLPIKKGGLIAMPAILPHMTGPNYTEETRKGYVIQFAPDAAYARILNDEEKELHIPANTENRQFLILKDGNPI